MSLEGTAENSNVPILKGKITTITVPQIDKTLTKAGQSAEAKATGEAIEKVKEDATEGVNEAKAAAESASGEAKAAAAVAASALKKSGATISMNAPTAEQNIEAGFQIGAMWIRPNYTLHNLAYSKLAEDFVASACAVTKAGQTFTATGNGDDKVIFATLEHGSETGWLYCVVTPDATAVSAKVITGKEEIALTVGEANVVKHKFSGTGVTFEVTYETANVAETGTIIIDNLIVIDEAATLEQVEADYRDVSDETVYGFVVDFSVFSDVVEVVAASWQHIHDGVWNDAVAPLRRFHNSLGNEYLWHKIKRTLSYSEEEGRFQLGTWSGSYPTVTVYYADNFRTEIVNDALCFVLDNSTKLSNTLNNIQSSTLQGRYFTYDNPANAKVVYYLPTTATIYANTGSPPYSYGITAGTKYSNPLITDESLGFVNSPDMSAFPFDDMDSVPRDDGLIYVFLGSLGDIARITHESATDEIIDAILGVTE